MTKEKDHMETETETAFHELFDTCRRYTLESLVLSKSPEVVNLALLNAVAVLFGDLLAFVVERELATREQGEKLIRTCIRSAIEAREEAKSNEAAAAPASAKNTDRLN